MKKLVKKLRKHDRSLIVNISIATLNPINEFYFELNNSDGDTQVFTRHTNYDKGFRLFKRQVKAYMRQQVLHDE